MINFNELQVINCVYHSKEWEVLVESGWTTFTVTRINGVDVATMLLDVKGR